MKSAAYVGLRQTTKTGYHSRIETIRRDHGQRTVAGLNRERILAMLQPYAAKPGAALSILKMLRVLIRHAIDIGWLKHDPSLGIKRPKTKEIRAWTDAELAKFEKRWPLGSKQRTAYALMLWFGAAHVDVHAMTWPQAEQATYTRNKSSVAVQTAIYSELEKTLAAAPRNHVAIITTEYGKPFTVNGFSGFMRDAIREAGLPLECKPHGLRKTLGRILADAGCTAHEIMAALGHKTLAEAERYTREADRRRGGKSAVEKLEAHRENRIAQPHSKRLGASAESSTKSD
jgi:integrase